MVYAKQPKPSKDNEKSPAILKVRILGGGVLHILGGGVLHILGGGVLHILSGDVLHILGGDVLHILGGGVLLSVLHYLPLSHE